ncbi:MAG: hypothetical protein MZV64_04755 [Ignavibacteriales bacterium]|nr:hypothetical protein [Ignavibacteriales bacterium]
MPGGRSRSWRASPQSSVLDGRRRLVVEPVPLGRARSPRFRSSKAGGSGATGVHSRHPRCRCRGEADGGLPQSPADQRGEGRGVDGGRLDQGLRRTPRHELPRLDLPVDVRSGGRPPAGDLLPGRASRNLRGRVPAAEAVGSC